VIALAPAQGRHRRLKRRRSPRARAVPHRGPGTRGVFPPPGISSGFPLSSDLTHAGGGPPPVNSSSRTEDCWPAVPGPPPLPDIAASTTEQLPWQTGWCLAVVSTTPVSAVPHATFRSSPANQGWGCRSVCDKKKKSRAPSNSTSAGRRPRRVDPHRDNYPVESSAPVMEFLKRVVPPIDPSSRNTTRMLAGGWSRQTPGAESTAAQE